MLALLLLSMATIFVLPIFIGIHQERVAIKQHEEALLLLEGHVLTYIHGQPLPELEQSSYNLETNDLQDGSKRFCLTWKGANSRDNQSCLYAKK